MQWFLAAAPIVIVALVLLYAFAGCTLETGPLPGVPQRVSPVTVVIEFAPPLAAENGRFDVVVDIASEQDQSELIILLDSLLDNPETVDDLLRFHFQRNLVPGGYRISCKVFAYDDEDLLLNGGLPIVGPTECRFTMPAAGDGRFVAEPGAGEFTPENCN
jgi:hypothetical protein